MVRDGFLELQERDQNNAITREYTWGLNLGGGISGLLNMRQNGQDYSYLYDGKGNITAVINSSQATVATYTYDEFGRVVSKSGILDQPFQFSTKFFDNETGLNYFGYRFYSSALGRWINRDPLEEGGGINLYAFVGNNSANSIDPFGLSEAKKPDIPKVFIPPNPSPCAYFEYCEIQYSKLKDKCLKACLSPLIAGQCLKEAYDWWQQCHMIAVTTGDGSEGCKR